MRRYFDIVVVVVVARKEEIEEGEVTIILSLFIIKPHLKGCKINFKG